jgi:hypothetical protein
MKMAAKANREMWQYGEAAEKAIWLAQYRRWRSQ